MSDVGRVVDAKTDGDRHEDREESVNRETLVFLFYVFMFIAYFCLSF